MRVPLLSLALVVGCGPSPPRLPPEPESTVAPTGSAAAGQAALTDRALGRSGFACADCHPVDAARRPAPPLAGAATRGGWWGGTAPSLTSAIQRCVERYGLRGPLGPRPLADLRAALQASPAPPSPTPLAPEGLYEAGCAHCHDGGPAGPIRDRSWPSAVLIAVVRGEDRPRHPDTLMPAFGPSVLSEAELAALVAHLVPGPTDR